MSMYWAGYHGIALVLTEKEFANFFAAYLEKHPDEEWLDGIEEDYSEEERSTPEDIYNIVREDCDTYEIGYRYGTDANNAERRFYCCEVTTDSCEGMELAYFDEDSEGKSFTHEDCYVFFSDRSDSVFSKNHYRDLDECLQEFKDKFAGYLPDKFNWDTHVGLFSYACFA